MTRLSKSKIIAHRQCPKRLWLEINQPELSVYSSSTEMRFQAGNKVGEIARNLHKNGVLIDSYQTQQALSETKEALKGKPRPIFEGAFMTDNVLIRADLILPGKHGCDLVEVKSSTSVKDYHLEDATIQTWVVKQAGLKLAKTKLAHIDTSFVYPGNEEYRGLLHYADISREVNGLTGDVPSWIKSAKKTLAGKLPKIDPGEQCSQPFDCPFMEYCIPQKEDSEGLFSPMILPNRDGKKLGAELIDEGYDNLCDVPESRFSNLKHLRIYRASKTGVAELDRDAGDFLRSLAYPRYYIDFESINPAVPIWAQSRPYQQIPFQWSCHVERKNGVIEHYEYLVTGDGDPRREFAESLIKIVKARGPVFVYSASFEKTRITELSNQYADLKKSLVAINERVVDLLPLARNYYYHPDMMGSWSIKAVLPTIAPDLAYDDLEVADGGMAMEAFAEMLDEATEPERIKQLYDALLLYCERDTMAMVKLAHFFEGKPVNA